MEHISISIDGNSLSVPNGSTILEAATSAGVRIPTLCTLKGLDPRANCRICVVEVEGSRTLQPACATGVTRGMAVRTDTPAVRSSRKTTLELLLSRHPAECHHCMRIGSSRCADLDPVFCEMCFFCDCVRDGTCELQALAREYGVDLLPYEIETDQFPLDDSTQAIIRNPNKCVKCRRCVDVCNEVQTVYALGMVNRGPELQVMPAQGKPLAESPCVGCGRCIDVCPTGAVYAREEIDKLLHTTHSYQYTTIAQISSDIHAPLAELYGMSPAELDPQVVCAGLRKIGVDCVVTDAAATAQLHADLARRFKTRTGPEPLIVTDSYAVRRFVDSCFPQLSSRICFCESAQQRFGKTAKESWAQSRKLNPTDVRTISITAENENAAEAAHSAGVDFVVNARQLHRIFMRTGVNLRKLRPGAFDSFGFAEEKHPQIEKLRRTSRWQPDIALTETELTLEDTAVRAAVGHTLGQARSLLAQIESGSSPYTIVTLSC